MNTEELEAAVRAAWDREAIAIYADHLQAIGDPRGELVAIDLRIDEGVVDAAITARREQLIAEWFGAELPPGVVHYGFVDVRATGMRSDSQLAVALRGPGAKYVRSVELAGPDPELAPALAELVAEPRPWLTRLVVHQWQDQTAGDAQARSRDRDAGARRRSSSVVATCSKHAAHPNVERLRVTGFGAFRAARATTIWSSLTSLDVAFHCQYAPTEPITNKRLQTLLPARCVPALRELDLSRNDRGMTEPHSLGGEVRLDDFLARYAGHTALAHVHLPRLYSADLFTTSLEALPALRELTVYDTAQKWIPRPRSVKVHTLER